MAAPSANPPPLSLPLTLPCDSTSTSSFSPGPSRATAVLAARLPSSTRAHPSALLIDKRTGSSVRRTRRIVAVAQSTGGIWILHEQPGDRPKSQPPPSSSSRPRPTHLSTHRHHSSSFLSLSHPPSPSTLPTSPSVRSASIGRGPPSTIAGPAPVRATARVSLEVAHGRVLTEHMLPAQEWKVEPVRAEREARVVPPTEEEDDDPEWGELRPAMQLFPPRERGAWGSEVVGMEMLEEGERTGLGGLVVLQRGGRIALFCVHSGQALGSLSLTPPKADDGLGYCKLEIVDTPEGFFALCHASHASLPAAHLSIVSLPTLSFTASHGLPSYPGLPSTLLSLPSGNFLLTLSSPSSASSSASSSPSTPHLLIRPLPLSSSPLPEASDAGSLAPLCGRPTGLAQVDPAGECVAWSTAGEVLRFAIRDQAVRVLGSLEIGRVVRDVKPLGEGAVLVLLEGRAEVWALEKAERIATLPLPSSHTQLPHIAFLLPRTPTSVRKPLHALLCVSTSPDAERPTPLELRALDLPRAGGDPKNEGVEDRRVWVGAPPREEGEQVSTVLGFEEKIIFAHASGILTARPFAAQGTQVSQSDVPVDGAPIVLHLATTARTSARFVVGGTDRGGVGVWEASTLRLIKKYTPFDAPVTSIAPVPKAAASASAPGLKDAVLLVSERGTVGVLGLEGPELLYLIPAAPSSLARIFLSADSAEKERERAVLLVYRAGNARAWEVRSGEFRRAMGREQVEEELRTRAGEWVEVPVDGKGHREGFVSTLRALQTGEGPAARTLLLDIRRLHAAASISPPYVPTPTLAPALTPPNATREASAASYTNYSSDAAPEARPRLDVARAALSSLLTWGLDPDIDHVCEDHLRIPRAVGGAKSGVGLKSTQDAITLFPPEGDDPSEVWTKSSAQTGARLLAICSLLRAFLDSAELEPRAAEVITFYSSVLPDRQDIAFRLPALWFLVEYWLDPCLDIQQSARMLFGAVLGRKTDAEVLQLVQDWDALLPFRVSSEESESAASARALLVLGQVAIDRFSLLSVATLKDISSSISYYLHSPTSSHRPVAVELSARGFQIWAHYTDPTAILRALFLLAGGGHKNQRPDDATHARNATLEIARVNTPLFMSTLCLEILQARETDARNATMKLLAFLVRKKPLVLYPSLPRMAEAVVRSLDPSVTSMREAVIQAATVILHEFVKAYPSIDFDSKTQRLAVGTHEGAVVMYDVKSATRLFVLEGHKHPLTALSFSPDGRRLVTVSLEESRAMVWKVGASLSSLFSNAFLPRQSGSVINSFSGSGPTGGEKTSEPFKSYDFNVGDEAHLTIAAVLEWVSIEWPAERTARLRIRETALTFAT